MENGSLAQVVKKWGNLTEMLCGTFMCQALEGLRYLHMQGIMHRDIKGANILTDKDAQVKLADFGVATKLDWSQNESQSGPGKMEYTAVGTPYWMAPELIEMGQPQADSWAACDMWSLGCTIIELMTGHPPYGHLEGIPAMYQIVNAKDPPEFPPGISAELKDFLLRCLQRDPSSRISSDKAFMHAWVKNSLAESEKPMNYREIAGTITEFKEKKHSFSEDEMSTMPPSKPLQTDRKLSSKQERKYEEGSQSGNEESEATVATDFGSEIRNKKERRKDKKERRSKKERKDKTGGESKESRRERKRAISGTQRSDPLDDYLNEGEYRDKRSTLSKWLDDEDRRSFQSCFHLQIEGLESSADTVEHFCQTRDAQKRQPWIKPVEDDGTVNDVEGKLEAIVLHSQLGISKREEDRKRAKQEINQYIESLEAPAADDEIIESCSNLVEIFKSNPEQKEHLKVASQHAHTFLFVSLFVCLFVCLLDKKSFFLSFFFLFLLWQASQGIIPIMELFSHKNEKVQLEALRLVREVISNARIFLDNLILIGLIPTTIEFSRASPHVSPEIRVEAAALVQQFLINYRTLQYFVACRGLNVLVDFLVDRDGDGKRE